MRRSPKDYCTRSKQHMEAHRQGKVSCCSCLQCLAVLRLIVERSRKSQPSRGHLVACLFSTCTYVWMSSHDSAQQ